MKKIKWAAFAAFSMVAVLSQMSAQASVQEAKKLNMACVKMSAGKPVAGAVVAQIFTNPADNTQAIVVMRSDAGRDYAAYEGSLWLGNKQPTFVSAKGDLKIDMGERIASLVFKTQITEVGSDGVARAQEAACSPTRM